MIDLAKRTSPYDLLQEQQVGRPYGVWRILVVCQLLNRTHGRQVRPMIDGFFEKWPSPHMLRIAAAPELKAVLKPLGFSDQRARSLKTMSAEYEDLRSVDPQFWRPYENGDWCLRLAGCGPYARDSLNLVVYGVLDEPTDDHYLERYRAWRVELRGLREQGLAP